MKKNLVSALTTALVVGAASTTFAAANPFSDVPAGHWAYDAVTQLAADGIVEGYGDGTYLGNRNITRYEMAQMVAKAMAKNPTGADKAALDRLAAEFSEELNNLGVRVSNLEKYADKVIWKGELRYTYQSNRFDSRNGVRKENWKNNVDEMLLRLEPVMEVNKNWKLKTRIDASYDMKEDNTGTAQLQQAWAEGTYGSFNVKIGRYNDLTSYDRNMMFFNQLSGVEVNAGNVLKVQARAGRMLGNLRYGNGSGNGSFTGHMTNYGYTNPKSGAAFQFANGTQSETDPMSMQSIALTYKPGKVFSLTGAYYHFNSDRFRNNAYTDNMKEDDANIWEVASTIKLGKVGIVGAYLKNTEADYFKHSHLVELNYGQAKRDKPGTWMAYASYRYQGGNVSMDGANDGAMYNTKGWEIGTQITIMPNIQLKGIYFNGEQLHNGQDAQKLFGRCEWFF